MHPAFQAVVAAPGFCVGVRCTEAWIERIDYLALCAEIAPANALAGEAARQLHAYLVDSGHAFDLPLRPSGTAFQRRVWAAISAIPKHETRTYGTLASGLHTAPRAVGQACGANPFPLLVPCHRVVAAGGQPGGFARQRSGFLPDIKRWLLAHEAC